MIQAKKSKKNKSSSNLFGYIRILREVEREKQNKKYISKEMKTNRQTT